MQKSQELLRLRLWLGAFIAGLILSGVTAFPLESEIRLTVSMLRSHWLGPIAASTGLLPWMERVNEAVSTTNSRFPFLAYGTDWLAFAHLAIAVAFIGPWIDPVRNKWVISFGLIACCGIIPLALVAGPVRGIPFAWRLIDCSFGIFGGVPLLVCRRLIVNLEQADGNQRLIST